MLWYWYLAPGSHGAYHWGFCADHRCAASSLIYDFLFPKTNGGDLSKRVRGKRGAITPGMRATDWFVAHRELLRCSALSPPPPHWLQGEDRTWNHPEGTCDFLKSTSEVNGTRHPHQNPACSYTFYMVLLYPLGSADTGIPSAGYRGRYT